MVDYKITIPCDLIKSFNATMGRNHWVVKKNKEPLDWYIKDATEKNNWKRIDKCWIEWIHYGVIPRDVDNLAIGLKYVLDSIRDQKCKITGKVDQRYIADDNYKYIEYALIRPIKVSSRKEERLELIVHVI